MWEAVKFYWPLVFAVAAIWLSLRFGLNVRPLQPKVIFSREEALDKKQRLFEQIRPRGDVAGVGIRSRSSFSGGITITKYWLVIYLKDSQAKTDLPKEFEGVTVEHDFSGTFRALRDDDDKPLKD